MRFFITGDCHGDLMRIYKWINKMNFNISNINVIIAGDAGICWRKDLKDLKKIISFHEEKEYKFHIWFIDGNHENFDILNSFKLKEKKDIIDISQHIHYISRGTILAIDTINGVKTLLCCGGADSVDKMYRTKGLNWWEEEAITQDDIDKVPANHYDYVLTHCCPRNIFEEYKVCLCTLDNINQDLVDHSSEDKLEELENKISFNNWIFGHHHIDKQLNEKFRCIFNDFIEIE